MPWTGFSFAEAKGGPQCFSEDDFFGLAVGYSLKLKALKRNRVINAPKSSDPVELKCSPSLPKNFQQTVEDAPAGPPCQRFSLAAK